MRWRELDIEATRDVRQTEHIYSCDEVQPLIRKTYPRGTAVLERAKLE